MPVWPHSLCVSYRERSPGRCVTIGKINEATSLRLLSVSTSRLSRTEKKSCCLNALCFLVSLLLPLSKNYARQTRDARPTCRRGAKTGLLVFPPKESDIKETKRAFRLSSRVVAFSYIRPCMLPFHYVAILPIYIRVRSVHFQPPAGWQHVGAAGDGLGTWLHHGDIVY